MHPMKTLAIAATLTLLAGCQSTRSSMHMNSDGGMPFFNFAIPVKNSAPQATFVEASAESSDQSSSIQQIGLERSEPQKKWGGWLNKLKQPAASIPLPRTDLTDDGTVLESDGPVVDGLHNF